MTTIEFIIAIISAAFASTGFWSIVLYKVQKKDKGKDALTRLILGIAHDKIMECSNSYIERGFVYNDEYGDFLKYYYEPYMELGGNGSAEKIVENQVKKLEIRIRS